MTRGRGDEETRGWGDGEMTGPSPFPFPFSIFHFPFLICQYRHLALSLLSSCRVCSCDFVDRSHVISWIVLISQPNKRSSKTHEAP